MKNLIVLTLAAAACVPAWAAKPCEELKAELTAKIESHGAKNFTLEAVSAADQTGDKRVVGSCEGGSKKIVYSRKAAEKKPA